MRAKSLAVVRTHGLYDHPLYQTWWNMLERCENPKHPGYGRYGGRGITVCERWHDVRLFISDIEQMLGPRPAGRTLDRYPDNDGNYAPGNVRWSTASEQARNRIPARRTKAGQFAPKLLTAAAVDQLASSPQPETKATS